MVMVQRDGERRAKVGGTCVIADGEVGNALAISKTLVYQSDATAYEREW